MDVAFQAALCASGELFPGAYAFRRRRPPMDKRLSEPGLDQLAAKDAPWRIVPTVEAVGDDKGDPDQTETQGELHERFNHLTNAPNPTFPEHHQPF